MKLVEDRWFPIVDLGCAVAGAVLWFAAAGLVSWQPLLLVLLPWLVRLLAGRSPFQRTCFDLPVLVFLLTALVGVWAAYDRTAAWSKFWILLSAVFLFYALAGQSRRDAWMVVGFLGVSSGLVGIYFLLSNNWQVIPADIGVLQRLALRWMRIRPNLRLMGIHPNAAGGVLAVLIPYLLAFAVYGWRRKRWELVGITAVTAPFTFFAFLMTSSRAAWLAVAVAAAVWFLWWFSRVTYQKTPLTREAMFGLMVLALFGTGLIVALLWAGGPVGLLSWLPGADNSTSRLELMQRTLQLWQDFPYTGGGLASFAGLYSTYIAVTPFFLFSYGHNFWLDVLLEQGPVGFLALLGVLVAAFWLLRPPARGREQAIAKEVRIFRWATFVSLIVMVLHGLMDDALYGTLGTPLLLLLPGMAVYLSGKRQNALLPGQLRSLKFAAVVGVAGIGLVAVFYNGLLGHWYANLGAVRMARIELQDWPTNEWDNGRYLADLAPAMALFETALLYDPLNRTAHHRLGLVAMQEQSYEAASFHLEVAYGLAASHRGIVKCLGFSYAWQGKLTESAVLLSQIKEARQEMNNYTRWWRRNGRADLAAQAEKMVNLLAGG